MATVITRSGPGAGRGYDLMPTVVGLCRKCRREMWSKLTHGPGRPVAVSSDGVTCEPCARYIREHPGKDPRMKKGNPAEQVPAERAEADRIWREEPLDLLCAGIGPGVFFPDPMWDEPQPTAAERREIQRTREIVAKELCAHCPVMRNCWQTAMTSGYEGVWGGRFFRRKTWFVILEPEISGPTIHAGQPRARQMIERLHRLGYNAVGEPLAGEAPLELALQAVSA
jgi:hypothetical protein